MADQDWKPVVLVKNKNKKPSTQHGIAKAKQAGHLQTVQKYGAGKQGKSSQVASAQKLEAEEADFKHASLGHNFKIALMQARQAKKWTQKELAQRINEKATVINDYEQGRVVPNPQIISKLSRALGAKLPRPVKPKKGKD